MRYLLVAVLILSLAAPAVLAGKDAVKAVKGKSIAAPNATAKTVQPVKNVEKKENGRWMIVTLRGGKLSAHVRVPVDPR
jgi:hypothetical protein